MRFARTTVLIGIAVIQLLGLTSCAGSRDSVDIQGTWELAWPEPGPQLREIKHITPTHFTWITYDIGSHELVAGGGGLCFQNGGAYSEQIDFAQGLVSELVGTVQSFRVIVSGDTLIQSGMLTNGRELREVWLRAHPGPSQGSRSKPPWPVPYRRPAPGGGSS